MTLLDKPEASNSSPIIADIFLTELILLSEIELWVPSLR